jgi:hypothetical protein
VELALPNVAAVLAGGIIAVVLNLMGWNNPVPDFVTPRSNPEENVTTSGLDLLKVHIEPFVREG